MKRPNVETSRRPNVERRKRPWLRRVGVVVGCLLVGAIINVLVACGCALVLLAGEEYLPNRSDGQSAEYAGEFDWFEALGWRPLPSTNVMVYPVTIESASATGVDSRWMLENQTFAHEVRVHSRWVWGSESPGSEIRKPLEFSSSAVLAMEIRFGWPMSSLTYGVYDRTTLINAPSRGSNLTISKTWGLPAINSPVYVNTLNEKLRIPIGAIWHGFLINTIFYGAIAWTLFTAPRAVRRHRRVKKRLCPDCGYDLRGADHGKCPECGEAVAAGNVKTSKRRNVKT